MNLGYIIKRLRASRGLNQQALGEIIGISQTSLSMIESGVTHPKSSTLNKICKTLEIPESFLYFLAVGEEDIPEEKRDLYKALEPALKSMILQLVGEDLLILEKKH